MQTLTQPDVHLFNTHRSHIRDIIQVWWTVSGANKNFNKANTKITSLMKTINSELDSLKMIPNVNMT